MLEIVVPEKPRSYDDVTYLLSNVETKRMTLEKSYEHDERKTANILWIKYRPTKTVWISLRGRSTGFIHEYEVDQEFRLISSISIQENTEISCFHFM